MGVQDSGLYKSNALIPELCQIWHIDIDNDSPAAIQAKVTWHLEQLFSKLSATPQSDIARVCFNLRDSQGRFLKRNLTGRREYISHLGGREPGRGPSTSTIQRSLAGIIDAFLLEIRRNPPPPTPDEVLVGASPDVLPAQIINSQHDTRSLGEKPAPSDLESAGAATAGNIVPADTPRGKSSPLFKRPRLLLTIAVAGIGVLFATTWLLPRAIGAKHNSPSQTLNGHPVVSASNGPVRVTSVADIHVQSQGQTFAFPQKLSLTANQLVWLNHKASTREYINWALANNGAFPDDGAVQIDLRGGGARATVINDIEIDKQCRSPLMGTLLFGPPGGAEGKNIQVGFNLDQRFPVAQDYGIYGDLSGNYIQEHHISFMPGETQTLIVHALTHRYYCEYRILLKIDTGRGVVYEKVDDHGKPFVVTATPDGVSRYIRFSDYKEFYVGGILSPHHDGTFVKEDPAKWKL
ncbi:MAG TPA: hypothetical protein VK513_18995 [Terriglobales bacterium]|nr:hypothetical protein [Terriglobales bacterium]